MKAQSEITQATVARGTDKITHETFYVVKSDNGDTTWYTVRWNNERLMWEDNCPASCADCKHVRAVNEVLRVRRARIALAMGGETPAIVAPGEFADASANSPILAMGGETPAIVARLQSEEDARRSRENNFALAMGF